MTVIIAAAKPEEKESRMIDRRIGLLVATLAIVASACTSGGATTAPQSEVPAASEPPAASAGGQ